MMGVPIKDLKEGMRVLLTDPLGYYTIGQSNPLVGTKYECEGTISSIDGVLVTVLWDNGTTNSYEDNTLSPGAMGSNETGRYMDLWSNIK